MGEDSPGTPGLLPPDIPLTGRAPFPVPLPSCRDSPASAGSQDLERSLVCSLVCASTPSHSVMYSSLQPPWTAACQASLSITNSQSLLKLMMVRMAISYVK